jgi:hypothetical protein
MNEKEDKVQSQTGEDHGADSSHEAATPREAPSRRELIERYGKYAIVGAPLLLFASKARAIHSKP